jgi:hypothetical protein
MSDEIFSDPERQKASLEMQMVRSDLDAARKAFITAETSVRSLITHPLAKESVLLWLNGILDRGVELQDDFS